MRQRTRMNGLAYHAKPEGKSRQNSLDRCKKQLQRLQEIIDSANQMIDTATSKAEAKAEKRPKAVITTVWGKEMKVSIKVFKTRYEPLGFKIVAEIY